MVLRMLIGVCLAVLAGCDSASPVDAGPDEPVLFLTQSAPPTSVLEALFQGRVEVDQAGCLRLGSDPDGPTVVWPFGSRLVREKTGLVVRGPDGSDFVRIGENVRLGGGEVSDLRSLGILPEAMLTAALNRCPGVFWLAGELLPPLRR